MEAEGIVGPDEAMGRAMIEIMIFMRKRLNDPLLDDHPLRGELLEWATRLGAIGASRLPASSPLDAAPSTED